MNKTKTFRLKRLIAVFGLTWLCFASAYAQNPQWVMGQRPTVPDPTNSNFTHIVFNYFLPGQEREEPYFINRISDEYKNTNGQRLNFDRIYGSYFNRQDPSIWQYYPNYSTLEIPAFIIARETGAPSSDIKVWATNNYPNGLSPYTFTNSSNQSLFNGQNGPQIYQGDEPEFTIIPKEGSTSDFFVFTYIRTAVSNGANGMLLYYIINTNTAKIRGPYYPIHLGGSLQSIMETYWGPRGAIAIDKIDAGSDKQRLFVAVENIGIYKFTIDHLNANNEFLNSNPNAGGSYYYPTRICAPIAINGGPAVNGSTFRTSELEISPDGELLAWADENNGTGGTNMATVYTINPNISSRIPTYIPVSSTLSTPKVNGLEFNPNYNPAAGINTRLYVTAGSGSSNNDGLFKISGAGTVTPITGKYSSTSKYCAQSQLEIDYNKALAMVYADPSNPNYQFSNYLPESSGQAGGWGDLQRYKSEALTTSPFNYPIHRLPRQVDNWDYKFGGTIYGKTAPLVADGGCSGGTVQRTVTYSAPVITSVHSWDMVYNWELKNSITGTTIQTGSSSTFQYTFPTTPFVYYDLILKVTTKEWLQTTNFIYQTRMVIRTTNGCQPPTDSRVAQTGADPANETTVYPNPVMAGELKIKLPDGYDEAQIEITDLQGRLVRKAIISNITTLNIHDLSAGMYMVNVTTPEFSKKEKIVVSK